MRFRDRLSSFSPSCVSLLASASGERLVSWLSDMSRLVSAARPHTALGTRVRLLSLSTSLPTARPLGRKAAGRSWSWLPDRSRVPTGPGANWLAKSGEGGLLTSTQRMSGGGREEAVEEEAEEEELLQRQSGLEMLAQTSLAGALREVVVKSSRSATVTRDPELEGIACVGCQRTCKYRRDRWRDRANPRKRESPRGRRRESKKENEFEEMGKSEGLWGRVKEREWVKERGRIKGNERGGQSGRERERVSKVTCCNTVQHSTVQHSFCVLTSRQPHCVTSWLSDAYQQTVRYRYVWRPKYNSKPTCTGTCWNKQKWWGKSDRYRHSHSKAQQKTRRKFPRDGCLLLKFPRDGTRKFPRDGCI